MELPLALSSCKGCSKQPLPPRLNCDKLSQSPLLGKEFERTYFSFSILLAEQMKLELTVLASFSRSVFSLRLLTKAPLSITFENGSSASLGASIAENFLLVLIAIGVMSESCRSLYCIQAAARHRRTLHVLRVTQDSV